MGTTVPSEEGCQVGRRQCCQILPLPLENIKGDVLILLLTLMQRLLLPQPLVKDLALLEGDVLKDVVPRQMNAAGGREDASMCLRLTQQFNPIVHVGCGDNMLLFNWFQRDLHHITIAPLQRQRVAGNDVVLIDEMHQRLLVIIAIANRVPDLGA